jgi:hypothetical protein
VACNGIIFFAEAPSKHTKHPLTALHVGLTMALTPAAAIHSKSTGLAFHVLRKRAAASICTASSVFAAMYCAQLSALSSALPGVGLSHILPCAVVAGDVQHISSLMQLLAELSHMPEGGQAVCSQQGLMNQVECCASLPRSSKAA